VLGFVMDRAAGVRPILGLPGGATLGQAVLSSEGLESVTLSPAGNYGLALLAADGSVALVKNLGGRASATKLESVTARPSRIAISPSGDAAALFYSESAVFQVLTGLPDSPSAAWSAVLSGLTAAPSALAVSDAGAAVLAAREGEPVVFATSSAQRVLTAAASSPSLAFFASVTDAAMADSYGVQLMRKLNDQPEMVRIGGPAEGLTSPVAIAVAQDGDKVFVANAVPAAVVALSLRGEEPVARSCDFTPTALDRMSGGAAFRLSEAGRGPVWLLDTGGAQLRVLFVPEEMRINRATIRSQAPSRIGGDR
jgi:hypothetical protein